MIVIDVETSGLDQFTNAILSIGAVDFSNPENQFYKECRLRDGASYDLMSLQVNGFSVAQINDPTKPTLKEILDEFLVWAAPISDVTLAGHNVQFDVKFMEAAFRLYDMKWIFGHRNLDTHALTYAHYLARKAEMPFRNNRSNITSDIVFNYVGLPAEKRPHNGLVGAKMEAESISRLLYGTPLIEEFEQYPVPEYLKVKL